MVSILDSHTVYPDLIPVTGTIYTFTPFPALTFSTFKAQAITHSLLKTIVDYKDPYDYINSLKYPPLYPIHHYH